ncbi:MAG TPA: lactate racemase domain-containing protein [Pirellulaceae bacterium]|jgi:hypothetical protein|nr:lactate racemase domain-containing protein [Pirellulaceae bacterium]
MPEYPRIFAVRQRFESPRVDDVPAAVDEALRNLNLAATIQPHETVAITAGSRGIANIPVILRQIVRHLTAMGARPFIVPAMGSHGGGTAEGQVEVLARLGITPETVEAPIHASMETVEVCQAPEGFPVHFDRVASQAHHVLVVGRVKPHTLFTGDLESGLMKMLLIGLGKHEGAKIYHRAILDWSFDRIVRSVAGEVLSRMPVVGGIAIVENGYDETALIEGVLPERFAEREKALLVLAKKWLPRIPFQRLDIALIDEIGKNVSGAGMDTNVIGRKFTDHMAGEHETPKIKRIAVRSITPESGGNGTGIGIAEFCRSRVLQQIDIKKTRVNCLTGLHPTAAMLPLDYATDAEILDAALPTIGLTAPADARLVWIRNTLHLAEFACSEALLKEVEAHPLMERISEIVALPLDDAGNLRDCVEDWITRSSRSS